MEMEGAGFWEQSDLTYEILIRNDPKLAAKYIVDLKLSKMALISSEVSEAVEAIRKDTMDDKITDMSGEVVELADVVIRILDYCGKYDLPLGEAIKRKRDYNLTRPRMHGKLA
jgi:NTP pyrophosphatase (non-canonical NTP hydrolase)